MPKDNKFSITVFFPCYNDAKSIKKLVGDAFQTVKHLTKDYEVIVVDDCSVDNSQKILQKLQKEHKKFKVIFHKKNLGYGGALRSGFSSASKQLVFYTDGDGQYDVKELPLLLSLMTDDVNFINGIKMARRDPTYRIIIGNLYSFFVRWLFWVPVFDVDCDFRLIRKELLDRTNLKSSSGSICIELVKKAQRAGAKFRQVSVHHYERRWGNSQFFVPHRILSTFWELASLWFKLMIIDKFLRHRV